MYVMYVIPHISNRILDFFWELPIWRFPSASWNGGVVFSCGGIFLYCMFHSQNGTFRASDSDQLLEFGQGKPNSGPLLNYFSNLVRFGDHPHLFLLSFLQAFTVLLIIFSLFHFGTFIVFIFQSDWKEFFVCLKMVLFLFSFLFLAEQNKNAIFSNAKLIKDRPRYNKWKYFFQRVLSLFFSFLVLFSYIFFQHKWKLFGRKKRI